MMIYFSLLIHYLLVILLVLKIFIQSGSVRITQITGVKIVHILILARTIRAEFQPMKSEKIE